MNNTPNTLPNPEYINVMRKMYLVPKDATIPGGMIYRHTGGYRAFDAEFVAASGGFPPVDRDRAIDFYTYEKVDSPEPRLTIQGGLVLGNVRFAHENPVFVRSVVMFLDGGKVAVAYPNGAANVSDYIRWDDFDPSTKDLIFDVIFDPEHDTANI